MSDTELAVFHAPQKYTFPSDAKFTYDEEGYLEITRGTSVIGLFAPRAWDHVTYTDKENNK